MQLIRGLLNIQPAHRSCVATIGQFDGVHGGHRILLQRLQQAARQYHTKTCVITFEPLAKAYLQPDAPLTRLSPLREKLLLLAACGVDQVLCLPFDQTVSSMRAGDFVRQVLVAALAIRHLVIGDDFRFGHDRAGDGTCLQTLGSQYGFTVTSTATVSRAGERISSTRIRALLAAGHLLAANRLLGHPLLVSGRVIAGQRLGRRLGFPTANIAMHQRRLPLQGVFAARVVQNQHTYAAVANIGTRPTLAANTPLLEVHLLDFTGELYHQRLQITFIDKLRDEQQFSSLAALQSAIKEDVTNARRLLASTA